MSYFNEEKINTDDFCKVHSKVPKKKKKVQFLHSQKLSISFWLIIFKSLILSHQFRKTLLIDLILSP